MFSDGAEGLAPLEGIGPDLANVAGRGEIGTYVPTYLLARVHTYASKRVGICVKNVYTRVRA